MTIKVLVLVFAVFFCINSYGDVYKCVDAKGHTLLTDKACSIESKSSQLIDESIKQDASKTFPSFFGFIEKIVNFFKNDSVEQSSSSKLANTEPVSSVQQRTYQCDGRTYCSQMTSCEEATFFIKNCPDTKMDGNNDGIPCEKQWCS